MSSSELDLYRMLSMGGAVPLPALEMLDPVVLNQHEKEKRMDPNRTGD